MKAIKGFSIECAQAMQKACGMESDLTFIERAQQCDFWGLYSGNSPVGALLVEMDRGRPSVHVGSVATGKSGMAICWAIKQALIEHKKLYAAIKLRNDPAMRLAEALGFLPLVRNKVHVVYGRML